MTELMRESADTERSATIGGPDSEHANASAATSDTTPSCAVLAPLMYLTVTIEDEGGAPRVHLHPGGQGFWVARMLSTLGCQARLIAPVGGESGAVLRGLMETWETELIAVEVGVDSPVQLHDRRSGDRNELVELVVPNLDRHAADDLYGVSLQTAMTCDAIVVTSGGDTLLPDESYRRLTHDLAAVEAGGADRPIIADVHGAALEAALAGGPIDVLKVSEDDLAADGWQMGSQDQAVAAARELVARGARAVVVSRADEPAIAAISGRVVRVVAPRLAAVEHRGAGDSMTGAIAAGKLAGLDTVDSIRLGAAAGAGNVTRRGLGSGLADLIAELTQLVEIEEIT